MPGSDPLADIDPLDPIDGPDAEQVFRKSPSWDLMKIQNKAKDTPGVCYLEGVEEVARLLGAREGVSGEEAKQWASRFVPYLISVFHGAHPPDKVGVRESRELRTLAEALDSLGRGDLPALGDVLIQRFKSVQQKAVTGSWATGSMLELIPETDVGLTSQEEMHAATKHQLLKLKLLEAQKSASKKGTG
jgi:hypothetical protein